MPVTIWKSAKIKKSVMHGTMRDLNRLRMFPPSFNIEAEKKPEIVIKRGMWKA